MRPKSSATVVVVLRSTPARLSTNRLGELSGSSVRSGLISVMEPISVVLPTPKPPATSSLTATGGLLATPSSKPAEPIGHLPENALVGQLRGRDGVVHADEAPL